MISTERSDLRDRKTSGNCLVSTFLEEIMVHCVAYDCLISDSRKTKGISFYKFQADNQRRMQAVMTNDLRASSSKTNPNLIVQSLEVMQYQPYHFVL